MRTHYRKNFIITSSGKAIRINFRHLNYAIKKLNLNIEPISEEILTTVSIRFINAQKQSELVEKLIEIHQMASLRPYFQSTINVDDLFKNPLSEYNLSLEDDFVPEFIYKYRDFNLNTLNILYHNELYFSDTLDFNDPLEGSFISEENSEDSEVDVASRPPVCCFSMIKNDILMYSHYSGSHQGLALEFATESPSHFIYEDGKGYEPFLYPIMYFTNLPRYEKIAVADIITSKASVWNYEKEVRLLIPNGKPGIYKFKPEILTGIYLGFKMPRKNKETIIDIARIKYPWAKIYEVERKRGKYEIEAY